MVATTDNKRRYNNNGNNNGSHSGNYNNNNSHNNYQGNNYQRRMPENIENLPCHIHPGSDTSWSTVTPSNSNSQRGKMGTKTARKESKMSPGKKKRRQKEIIKNPRDN